MSEWVKQVFGGHIGFWILFKFTFYFWSQTSRHPGRVWWELIKQLWRTC